MHEQPQMESKAGQHTVLACPPTMAPTLLDFSSKNATCNLQPTLYLLALGSLQICLPNSGGTRCPVLESAAPSPVLALACTQHSLKYPTLAHPLGPSERCTEEYQSSSGSDDARPLVRVVFSFRSACGI